MSRREMFQAVIFAGIIVLLGAIGYVVSLVVALFGSGWGH